MSELVSPGPDGFAAAARALREGGLVCFPTDTVYGVACLAADPGGREAFYAAKQRPADQPAILMVPDRRRLTPWVEIDERSAAFMDEHWPGALTLVLPATAAAEASFGPVVRDGTLAVRIPDHPVALGLLRAAAGPLATSSANRAGEGAPTTAEAAVAALGGDAAIVLDGVCELGEASSILDLTGPEPRLIREGSLPAERLLQVNSAAQPAPATRLAPARIPLEEVYMRLAEELARRSTCRRRSVGAVITSADLTRVLGVGYNGGARGINNECLTPGGPDDPCATCIHAETNAIAKAGAVEPGKWAMITHSPCVLCATLLINSNVAHVLYRREYRDRAGVDLLHRAGIDARQYAEFGDLYRGPLPDDPA